ncbi:MAG: DsrE family protein [Myxococcales bacterium]|nr:MAG: DsrE family protein [Myxococcales bacterium]
MALKVLNIVESAYRATLEEQDDTILWTTTAMRGAGADVDVLLRGNAVNYGVRGQDASGLQFGERKQTHPPRLDNDVKRLIDKGAKVYVLTDDAADRGLEPTDLVDGLEPISRSNIGKLCADYDQIWHW